MATGAVGVTLLALLAVTCCFVDWLCAQGDKRALQFELQRLKLAAAPMRSCGLVYASDASDLPEKGLSLRVVGLRPSQNPP